MASAELGGRSGGGGGYRIADEPRAGLLAHLTVNPLWPLFAVMFGGAWLSWPWFVLNGWAMGSPTRVRETLFGLGAWVGSVLLLVALIIGGESLPEGGFKYLFLLHILYKLGVTYRLYVWQMRPFQLHEYYDGPVRNGVLVLVAGFLLGSSVVMPAVNEVSVFWGWVLQ
jgi:hypothetical protein